MKQYMTDLRADMNSWQANMTERFANVTGDLVSLKMAVDTVRPFLLLFSDE